MPTRTLDVTRPVMAPSMLKCDFANLMAEVRTLEAAQSQMLHWDVMDGHFVPNLSYGAMVIERVRSQTDLFFDAHLMISDPAKYLDDYVKAGCDAITFHIEAVPQPTELLQRIRAAGVKAGLALNPATPVSAVAPFVADCDLLLVMSVNPGFGGQAFMPDVLPKVTQLRQLARPEAWISIDGGIGPKTIADSAAAGAQLFVAGSSIFDQPDYAAAMRDMEARAAGPR
ncbi:ribulose-phosphate 3-epimerase [bacterium]|nr:ribulose-phosphate 3-epimerase [bacterium]